MKKLGGVLWIRKSDSDARVGSPEGSDQWRQWRHRQGRKAGQVQTAGSEAGDFLHGEAADLHVAAGLTGRQDERFAGRGQHHGPTEATERRGAEILFEFSDRLGDRRLRQSKGITGGREAPLVHHR